LDYIESAVGITLFFDGAKIIKDTKPLFLAICCVAGIEKINEQYLNISRL